MEADNGSEKREGGGVTTAFEDAWSKAGGYSAIGRDLLNHCARYFNNGGTIDEFDRVIAEARERMVEAACQPVPKGHSHIADLHQPVSEPGGHTRIDSHIDDAPSAREAIAGSGGRIAHEAPWAPAPAVQQPIPGEASQIPTDTHQAAARSVRELHSDPAGHTKNATPAAFARGDRNQIAGGEATRRLSIQANNKMPPAREPRGPSDAYLRAAARSRLETVRTALYLHKTSTGKWYGDVCPYEFPGMKRDAKFAEAFEKVFGPFNEKQQRMKCGELLSAKQQEQVWELINAA